MSTPFRILFLDSSIEYQLVDPTVPEDLDLMISHLKEQGAERHVVLHKISDFAKCDEFDILQLVDTLSERFSNLAGLRVINSFGALRVLADRWRTAEFIRMHLHAGVHLPHTRLSDGLNGMSWPAVWKPISACGRPGSHSMLFLPNPNACISLDRGIFQEYIRHAGVVYKVYVIGDQVYVDIRPSIRTRLFVEDAEPSPFDSDYMKQLDPLNGHQLSEAKKQVGELDTLIRHTSRELSGLLDLELFGWDLIVSDETRRPYIIDINYFPKFEGFPDFYRHLLSVITKP